MWRAYLQRTLEAGEEQNTDPRFPWTVEWQKFLERKTLDSREKLAEYLYHQEEKENGIETRAGSLFRSFLSEMEELLVCPTGLAVIMHTVFLAQKYDMLPRNELAHEVGYLANVL
eukprot:GSA25T00005736001.1